MTCTLLKPRFNIIYISSTIAKTNIFRLNKSINFSGFILIPNICTFTRRLSESSSPFRKIGKADKEITLPWNSCRNRVPLSISIISYSSVSFGVSNEEVINAVCCRESLLLFLRLWFPVPYMLTIPYQNSRPDLLNKLLSILLMNITPFPLLIG